MYDVYYIHPKLRIGDYRYETKKRAEALSREHRESKGTQRGSIKGALGGARESIDGSVLQLKNNKRTHDEISETQSV